MNYTPREERERENAQLQEQVHLWVVVLELASNLWVHLPCYFLFGHQLCVASLWTHQRMALQMISAAKDSLHPRNQPHSTARRDSLVPLLLLGRDGGHLQVITEPSLNENYTSKINGKESSTGANQIPETLQSQAFYCSSPVPSPPLPSNKSLPSVGDDSYGTFDHALRWSLKSGQ